MTDAEKVYYFFITDQFTGWIIFLCVNVSYEMSEVVGDKCIN